MGAVASCFAGPERASPPPKRRRMPRAAADTDDALAAAIRSYERKVRSSAASGSARYDSAVADRALRAAAALVLQQEQGGGFDRSASQRYSIGGSGRRQHGLPRSASSRPRDAGEAVVPPQQLLAKDLDFKELETSTFVLVHGGGFGAWCWYKTIALLEDGGFTVNAIDLAGSGVNSVDSNKITSLLEYSRPLTTYLEELSDDEKVILIGHDLGGVCISRAMEMFPTKVAKAVFVCAAMLGDGQSMLDMFNQQMHENDDLRKAHMFLYSNGKDKAPTAIDLEKSLLKDLLFNQSPGKDVALASVSMRPIPFAPAPEKLTLSADKYGSVRRFYVETTEDNALPLSLQQSLCTSNPPEKVFRLKGADHSPFFSKPQALHKILVEIAKISPLPSPS